MGTQGPRWWTAIFNRATLSNFWTKLNSTSSNIWDRSRFWWEQLETILLTTSHNFPWLNRFKWPNNSCINSNRMSRSIFGMLLQMVPTKCSWVSSKWCHDTWFLTIIPGPINTSISSKWSNNTSNKRNPSQQKSITIRLTNSHHLHQPRHLLITNSLPRVN